MNTGPQSVEVSELLLLTARARLTSSSALDQIATGTLGSAEVLISAAVTSAESRLCCMQTLEG